MLAVAALAGMALWVRAHRVAFDLQEWCGCAASTITIRELESRPAARGAPREPHELVPVTTEHALELVPR